jgi:Flp pilus assembly protein CpaB
VPPVITPQVPATAPPRGAFNQPTVKKKNSPMLIISAVAMIGCLVIGAVRMVANSKPPEDVTVVAAAADLPAGCRIGYSNLHYMTVPKRYYLPSMYSSYEQLVGKVTRTFIGAREPLTNQVVISSDKGLAGELPKGYRAITLKLTNDATVDGQARPGDRVDVLVTSDYKSKKYTKTICENLLVVLSMPKEAVLGSNQSQETNKVTVAANPADAEILSQAMEEGKIRLTLRSLGDLSKAALRGADIRDLVPADALHEEPPVMQMKAELPPPMPPPPLPPAPPSFADLAPIVQAPVKWAVQMFSGSSRVIQEVEPTSTSK